MKQPSWLPAEAGLSLQRHISVTTTNGRQDVHTETLRIAPKLFNVIGNELLDNVHINTSNINNIDYVQHGCKYSIWANQQ